MQVEAKLLAYLSQNSAPTQHQAPSTQNPVLDSLKNAFDNAKHDTIRVQLYLELSEATYLASPEKSTEYDKKALALAEKNIPRSKGAVLLAFKKAKADALNNIGYIYNLQGNPDKALEYYLQSLEIRKEINDKRGIAESLNNIGAIYKNQGNPDKALEYYLQSLEIQKEINVEHPEESGNKQGIAISLNNIG
ncbi:MAG: tetratricopeptide repeat protein, partial [Solirubrobacterales bacterium]|nr:tetratricopeptide repeat protein [Solirubrobacterales bacterium]